MARVCTGECFTQVNDCGYPEVGENCPNSTPCTLQKCVNFPMCGIRLPLYVLQCKGGRCIKTCDMMYGRSFEFFAPEDMNKDECPVCLEHAETYMKYPCGHVICPSCFCPRSLVYPEQPSADRFGFNISDEIEDDDEYEKCFQEWTVQYPDQHASWQAAVSTWEENQPHGDWEEQMELMKKCPLCKREGAPIGTNAHWNNPECFYQPPGL